MRVCYSPELRSMNKDSSTSFRNSGPYTSPGTPDYRDNHGGGGGGGGGFQKGWCSERVPLPSNGGNRRRASSNVLMNGRTLPSKWDDAERWITSPVSGSGFCKSVGAPPPSQRRPKSKSGPLGDTPYFSPSFPFLESNNSFLAGSPFSTGVLVPNGLSFHHAHTDYTVTPSADMSLYPDSQDEKIDENSVTRVISRRDMATQMSPVDSPVSSPNRRPPPSSSPPPIPSSRGHHSTRVEMRDVEVDKGITVTKQTKRHPRRTEKEKNRSTEIKNLDLTWSPTEGATELSKLKKEEARIAAWENLQTAKAEASIRKLEMKLEKKKSASMDRIMKKLRIAQMKAQQMRKTMNEAPRTSHKIMSLQRYANISLISCFRPDHS